jgi:hypothetical protein
MHEVQTPQRQVAMATMEPLAKRADAPSESGLCPDPVGLSRYHASANTVLCVGIVSGVLFGAIGWLPVWGGFLAGTVPAFLVAALAHTLRDKQ